MIIINRIQLLDKKVSSKIAAGEVIERPASIVRELLDNSIDSGAKKITIEISDGGKKLIKVSDNGHGIPKDDLELSVQKHTTSKITSVDELHSVVTLGFRGEALFSIATVSRLKIISQDKNSPTAGEVVIEDGDLIHLKDGARAEGTTIEVTRLFFHVPARLEFLNSSISEARKIKKEIIEKMVASPNIAFEYIVDGKIKLKSSAGSILKRIGDLFSHKIADDLISVTEDRENISISGYISPVHLNSSTRKDQHFIVNGRPFFSPAISHAAKSGYGNMLEGSKFPLLFLIIGIDPTKINVNVHPAKKEIRFSDEKLIYSLIRSTIKNALSNSGSFAHPTVFQPISQCQTLGRDDAITTKNDELINLFTYKTTTINNNYGKKSVASNRASIYNVNETNFSEGRFDGYKIAGYFFTNYWLLQKANSIIMVDQHAADERVLYEKLKTEYFQNGVVTQPLLIPLSFSPGVRERGFIMANQELLKRSGFLVELFGPEQLAIYEVPIGLKGDELDALKRVIAIIDGDEKGASNERIERMLSTLACRSAVKQGDNISELKIVEILDSLNDTENPFSCPHGRPSIIEFNKKEVEKWFHRR